MLRRALLVTLTVSVLLAPSAASVPPPVSPGADVRVTGQQYVRYDGGTDATIALCNSEAAADFGNNTQNNEPFSVVDPQNPDLVLSGWNDYCSGWMGLGLSRDGGRSWKNSLVPGYVGDTSAGGQASPEFGRTNAASDPLGAFDNDGRFYFGAISFNENAGPKTNADIWVARYETRSGVYPLDYLGTTQVESGTPSANFFGQFNDKPMLEVDRTSGPFEGNVYMCWSRFVGNGQNKIFFSRSADHGETFSKPVAISTTPAEGNHAVQGCDIAVESDGDVHVIWRNINTNSSKSAFGIGYARSTDGGLSFAKSRTLFDIILYNPFDTARDCGDGTEACPSGFVFGRVPLEPRVTSDPTGQLAGVFVVYNAVDPATVVPSGSPYSSAGAGLVGQSKIYITRLDGVGNVSGTVVAPSAGHAFFPDADALAGKLAVVWQDSRRDPSFTVQRPVGNEADQTSPCQNASGVGTRPCELLDTFTAVWDGTSFGSAVRLTSVGQQPQYEMFSARSVPFLGDYNWIQLVDTGDGLFGYATWTDNRDVLPGADPRESPQDGFDVDMCVVQAPDGTFGPNTCPNSGGLDQNIYGNSITIG